MTMSRSTSEKSRFANLLARGGFARLVSVIPPKGHRLDELIEQVDHEVVRRQFADARPVDGRLIDTLRGLLPAAAGELQGGLEQGLLLGLDGVLHGVLADPADVHLRSGTMRAR